MAEGRAVAAETVRCRQQLSRGGAELLRSLADADDVAGDLAGAGRRTRPSLENCCLLYRRSLRDFLFRGRQRADQGVDLATHEIQVVHDMVERLVDRQAPQALLPQIDRLAR
jgi:hypothetical protein